MHMLEFKKLTDFPRGTLYNILCDAYSYDDRNKRFWDGNWKETGDYLYYEIVLSKKYYVLEALLVQGRILWLKEFRRSMEHINNRLK